MRNTFFLFCRVLCLCLLISFFTWGCSNSSSSDGSDDTNGTPSIAETFVTNLYDDWNGVDWALNPIDGFTDSDDDGEVDTNDAINFIETLKGMGYNLPETTVDGLYGNYYTDAGYDEENEDLYPQVGFTYTEDSSVTEADLKNADWTGLEQGDLIFVDYDRDGSWDNAAVYMGAFGGYDNAAFVASDYYDECVLMDLDYSIEWINQDIQYGYSDVKKPVFDSYPAD